MKSNTTRTFLPYLLQIGIFILILSASLFTASGRLDWVMAWGYIGLVVVSQGIVALILIPNNPELVKERAQFRGERNLDRVLAGIMALFGPASMCIIAGLDMRFGWLPHIPLTPQIAALGIAMLGSLLTTWAITSNKFFYGVLRIAKERGHAVCIGGPYRYVRHPGYLGAILFDLATPLMLNSVWALIPAAFTVCAIAVRTALEDRALQDGLYGYKDYAQRVRYRLLPGVW